MIKVRVEPEDTYFEEGFYDMNERRLNRGDYVRFKASFAGDWDTILVGKIIGCGSGYLRVSPILFNEYHCEGSAYHRRSMDIEKITKDEAMVWLLEQ